MSTGSTVTRLEGGDPSPPLSRRVADLLGRSDAEVVAARLSQDPAERFVHAHLAALRAAAALVERSGQPRRRGGPRTVWGMVHAMLPHLGEWTGWFADAAPRRAAVESGRWATVASEEADTHLALAEQFQDVVRAELGVDGPLDGKPRGAGEPGAAVTPEGPRGSARRLDSGRVLRAS